jgi:hypothetical protein
VGCVQNVGRGPGITTHSAIHSVILCICATKKMAYLVRIKGVERTQNSNRPCTLHPIVTQYSSTRCRLGVAIKLFVEAVKLILISVRTACGMLTKACCLSSAIISPGEKSN